MMALDIGDGAGKAPVVTSLSVQPGATVVVKNIAGGTVNYYTDVNGSASTITTGNTQSFTAGPVWLQAASNTRTSIQLTGTGY